MGDNERNGVKGTWLISHHLCYLVTLVALGRIPLGMYVTHMI